VEREDAVPASGIDTSGSGATLAGYGPLPTVARASLDFRCRNVSVPGGFTCVLSIDLWCGCCFKVVVMEGCTDVVYTAQCRLPKVPRRPSRSSTLDMSRSIRYFFLRKEEYSFSTLVPRSCMFNLENLCLFTLGLNCNFGFPGCQRKYLG
jgi:hypothetical protein